MTLSMFLGAAAGLGLFLYGMNLMSDGLQKVAGNKLKSIIQKLTKNRLMAIFVGCIVTMIIQSSSATSVMLVGFVNAGIMSLAQATGIIFGANIGTTITGQMVSLNISELAPIAIVIGLFTKAFIKKSHLKDACDILIGFGILFIGMNYLKDSLAGLKDSPLFIDLIVKYGSNPFISLFIGILMTFILQSSSATIGVLIALASNGIVPFYTALFIIFGDNIGTCTTALLSSLGTSRKGKRVAFIHLLFNIIGTIYFMLFLTGPLTSIVTSIDPDNVPRQIANAHSLFNIINVIVLTPFTSLLLKLVYFIIPETPQERQEQEQPHSYLDTMLLKTPAFALKNAIYEMITMATFSKQTMTLAIDAIQQQDNGAIEQAFISEKKVNTYEKNIVQYLVALSQQDMISNEELEVIDHLFNTVHDIERVSDHAENIAENAKLMIQRNIVIESSAMTELNHVYRLAQQCFSYAIDALSTADSKKIQEVYAIENEIDALKLSIRNQYVRSMNQGLASPESGLLLMDMLSDLERISDHCLNIGQTVDKIGNYLAE